MVIVDDGQRTCSKCLKRYYDHNRTMIRTPICKNCINQPKRSKREDDIMYLFCGIYNDYYHILTDQNHIDRCGALNIMET